MDIHLRDLKYFEVVADLGHVGQAADKLQAARQSTRTAAGSSGGRGGQPITVAPATPTATPPHQP